MTSRKRGKGKNTSILTLGYILLVILQWISSAMPFHPGAVMVWAYFFSPAFGAFLYGTLLLILSTILVVLFLIIEHWLSSIEVVEFN